MDEPDDAVNRRAGLSTGGGPNRSRRPTAWKDHRAHRPGTPGTPGSSVPGRVSPRRVEILPTEARPRPPAPGPAEDAPEGANGFARPRPAHPGAGTPGRPLPVAWYQPPLLPQPQPQRQPRRQPKPQAEPQRRPQPQHRKPRPGPGVHRATKRAIPPCPAPQDLEPTLLAPESRPRPAPLPWATVTAPPAAGRRASSKALRRTPRHSQDVSHSAALLRRAFRIGLVFALAALAAIAMRVWVLQPFYIPSESMEPTLHGCAGCNDDRVLVDKLSYRTGKPSTGDVVVFHRPSSWLVSDDVLVKRVIGLPGDHITITGGFVVINGHRLSEPYVNKRCGTQPTQSEGLPGGYTVPQGDVFVMGDNRCDSDDSRQNGPVPVHDIIGRAFMIIWPVNRITTL